MGDTEPSLELPHLFGRKKKKPERDAPAPAPAPEPEARKAEKPAKAEQPAKQLKRPKEPKPPKAAEADDFDESREFKLPALPGRWAAIITGVLVGLLGAVLTWGSLQACEAFKGTESCGGEGAFLLLVVVLLMILAGGVLLAAWEVADPKSTSALGVGIMCVLILLLLMEELLDPWMFLVVPVVSALAYAAAHWVTTSLVEESELEPGPGEQRDIR